jgi:internalin A
MPKWPFDEPLREPAMEEALLRIEKAWESGASVLNLSDFKLSTLPEAIGQLSRLHELNLSGNQLSTLPEAIGRLSELQRLDLSINRLSTLPEAIGQLSQLQVLDLSVNRLSALPEAIGQLSQLQVLDLSYNRLSTLPEAIGQLSQLQVLNLSGNRLSTLPEALQSLVKLEKLFLHGNLRLGLPDEVLGPTIEEFLGSQRRRAPKPSREILDYYFATRGAEGRALRELKLIVVGRGGAGKTSLIKRLKGEPFDPNEGERTASISASLSWLARTGRCRRGCGTSAGSTCSMPCTSFSSPRSASTCWCSASATTWPRETPPTGSNSFAATPE